MKKVVSAMLISSLVFSSVSFAAGETAKPVTVKPTVLEEAKTLVNFKINAGVNANEDFSKTFLHTAKNFDPYTFDLKAADFATEKWSKYVSAVYVQATDVNYYVSSIHADGTLKQVIALTEQEVARIIQNAKTLNDSLRKEALAKPEQSYVVNYKNVYQAPWMLVDEKALVSSDLIADKDLQSSYMDLAGILVNNYKVYKKGSAYVLIVSAYPMGTWNSTTSAIPTDLDDMLGKIIEKNTKLLTK